jgi:DNA-binding transcriptional regulator YiaG
MAKNHSANTVGGPIGTRAIMASEIPAELNCLNAPPTVRSLSTRSMLKTYDATKDIGAPFRVILRNSVLQETDETSGEIRHIIPSLGTLVAVLAVLRALHPLRFSGEDVRFVRRSVCKKGVQFAEMLLMTPENLSRYENNKVQMSESAERLLRLTVITAHFEVTKMLKVVQSLNVIPETLCDLKLLSLRSVDSVLTFELQTPFVRKILCDYQGNWDFLDWKRAV